MSDELYGFAGGFARGYENSYRNRKANEHDKEMADKKTEAQKALYGWKEQQAAYKAKNAEEAASIKAAKEMADNVTNLTAALGGSDQDSEAITLAVNTFGSPKAVIAAHHSGAWKFTPNASNALTPSQQGADLFDTQTSESSAKSSFPVKKKTSPVTTLTQAAINFDAVRNNPESTPEEIARAGSGYQSALDANANKIAMANNSGVKTVKLLDENGEVTGFESGVTTRQLINGGVEYSDSTGNKIENVSPLQAKEQSAYGDVLKAMNIPVKQYNANILAVSRVTSLAGDLIGIVDTNPNVLASVTSRVAQTIQGIRIELNAAQQVLEKMRGPQGEDGEYARVTLQQFEENILPNGVSLESIAKGDYTGDPENAVEKLAHATDTFNAKMILMAFRAGGVEGQVGMAMSNKDFDRLKDVVASSKDSETFKRQLAQYVNDGIEGVNHESTLIQNDQKVRGFKTMYNYDPLLGEGVVVNFDSFVSKSASDRLRTGVALVKQYAGVSPTDNGEQSVSTTVETPRFTPEQIRAEIERRKSLQRGE